MTTMPFKVEPVPAPKATFIDLSDATEDDRLLIEFESGQKLVCRMDPPPRPAVLRCDLARTSPELLAEFASALLKRARLDSWRFWVEYPTIEEMRTDIDISLDPSFVTAGLTLYVRVRYTGRSKYISEAVSIDAANGSPIKSMTSYVPTKAPMGE